MNQKTKDEVAKTQIHIEQMDIPVHLRRWLILNFEIIAELGYLHGRSDQLERDEKKFKEIMANFPLQSNQHL